MSDTTNEQIATDAPEDVEGHHIEFGAVADGPSDPELGGVEGHHFRDGAADSDDISEADDTEGHNFKI